MIKVKKLLFLFFLLFIVFISLTGGALFDRLFGYKLLDKILPRKLSSQTILDQKILTEESAVIDIAEKISPSVVTVSMTKTQSVVDFGNDPFSDSFGFFGRQMQGKSQEIKQDIGSGFVISKDGLVITNKHVVEDATAKYRVITKDNKELEVKQIYRDPVNDMAILRVDPPSDGLAPVELGDSDNLKVGQFVVAIGTALGEFRHTVTTGVISGLGRGIDAGSPYEGSTERLDNVIQTDAAINPGNSGGPLINSAGQVIGVNVAVAAQGQNIGFALPINIIKDSLDNFNKTGKFERPFLGVRYKMIGQDLAILNEVPQGAYVVEVVSGSPAAQAGVKVGDIITKIDGSAIKESNGGLAKIVSTKKVGDKIRLTIWRDGKEGDTEVQLKASEG